MAIVPLVFVDRVNRYVLLPELAVACVGILIGYVGWLLYGGLGELRNPPVLAAIGFLLVEVLSVFAGHSPSLSLVPVLTDFVYVSLMVLVVVGLTRPQIEQTVSAAAFVCGVVSLLGLLQYLDIGRQWVPTSGLPSGTLGHRNIAAAYVVGTLPLIIWKACGASVRSRYLLWTVCGVLGFAFVVATRSRAAWLSVVLTLTVFVVLSVIKKSNQSKAIPFKRFRIASLVGGIVFVALVSMIPATIDKRDGEAMWHEKASIGQAIASVTANGGDKGRLILWDSTLEMIQNQPIIGVGPGNWRIQFPAYADGRMMDANAVPHRPHNDFLTIASESGLLALGLYVGLLFFAFRNFWRHFQGPDRHIAFAMAAAILGSAVNSMFGFPKEFVASSAPLWLGMGVLASLDRLGASERDAASGSAREKWLAATGSCAALLGLITILTLIQFDSRVVEARLAAARSNWPGVLEVLGTTSVLSGVDEQAHLLEARAHEGMNQPEDAATAYAAGLSIHPHSPGLWLGLGNAQRRTTKLAAAEESFRNGLKYDPRDGRILNNLGSVRAALGDLEQATEFFRQAIEAEATPADAFGNLSTAYRRSGKLDEAVEAAALGLAEREDADLRNAQGNALAAKGDHRGAVHAFGKGLETTPDHVQLRFNLARSYEVLDEPGLAIRTYQIVLRLLGDQYEDRRKFIENRISLLERGAGSAQ